MRTRGPGPGPGRRRRRVVYDEDGEVLGIVPGGGWNDRYYDDANDDDDDVGDWFLWTTILFEYKVATLSNFSSFSRPLYERESLSLAES